MMSRFFISKLFIFTFVACLAGCQQQQTLSYSYLITHPAVLAKKSNYCEQNRSLSQEDEECKTVMRALTDFTALVREQQFGPEKFGEKIMQAEAASVVAQEKMTQAQMALTEAQTKQNADAIAKAKTDYLNTQEAYDRSHEQVQTLLAVASLSSPG